MPLGSASWELLASRRFPFLEIDSSVVAGTLTTVRPMALIIPAKSHPEVIVQAVAARNHDRATAFAKKHGIPEVKNSYEGEH